MDQRTTLMLNGNHHHNLKRVLITGLGVTSPLGSTVSDFWEGLLDGKSGTAAITDMDLSQCRTRIGAQVPNYDAKQHFSRKELQRLSRTSQLALIAAGEAIANAELKSHCDPSNVAVVLGGTIGGYTASEPVFRRYFEDGTTSPYSVPVLMNVGPASNISIRFGFKGPLMEIDGAC